MSGAWLEYQSWSILKALTKRVLQSWGPVGLRSAKHSLCLLVALTPLLSLLIRYEPM